MHPYAWMLVGAFCFAVMSSLAHALGDSVPWQIVAGARAGLALLFSLALCAAARVRLAVWRPRTLWVRSFAGSVSLVCGFYALSHMEAVGDVLALTNMFPLWIALLSWPVLGEVPTGEAWLSIVTGLVGVAVLHHPHFQTGDYTALLAVISSVASAVAMLGLHQLHEIDPRAIVVHFSGVSFVVCVAACFALPMSEVPAFWSDPAIAGMMIAMGFVGTVGQVCLTKAFAAGDPAKVSVVGLSQVAFGVVFDVLIWQRTFTPLKIVGMSLIMAPTVWLLLRRRPAEPEASVL